MHNNYLINHTVNIHVERVYKCLPVPNNLSSIAKYMSGVKDSKFSGINQYPLRVSVDT